MDRLTKNIKEVKSYRLRILGSLVASLILVTTCFKCWPIPEGDGPPDITYDMRGQEVIILEEILQTRQEQRKPPPPPPLPPVVVPDDLVLDDIEIDLPDNLLDIDVAGEDTESTDGAPINRSGITTRADSGPRPVRIVEPEYSRAASRRNIRAQVIVEVLVEKTGQVLEANVVESWLLNKDNTRKQKVESVGHGIEEAAISAAQNWLFRPAIKDGHRVRAVTRLTFSFGI